MKLFHYTALDKSSREQRGVVEALDRQDAGQRLRGQGLFPLELNDADVVPEMRSLDPNSLSFTQLAEWLRNLMPVSEAHKVFFFRQIALMLRSGLPLTDALKTVQGLVHGKLCQCTSMVLDSVQAGDSFSTAIAKHGTFFPEMAEHMIRSAEASGQMDEVMSRVADHIEQKAELKRQIMTTMFYPVITLLLAVLMFVFLVTGVIPKFAKFFENSGKPIPPETQSLLDLADFVSGYGLFILLAITMLIGLIFYSYSQPAGRVTIDRILLRVPLIGSIITLGSMSQATWSLSMLLRSGLPLVESLSIVKKLIGNSVIADAFHDASEAVLHGRDLGSSLRSKYITPLVRQLATVGERSGALDAIMLEAGGFYKQALEAKNKLLGTLIEPAAILLIGGMVAYVYIAFFKAIFAISGG